MNIKINIAERFGLLNIIPAKGSYDTLVAADDLRKKLNFTQPEVQKYGIKGDEKNPGVVVWNKKATKAEFKFEFTELEKVTFKAALEALSKENELPNGMRRLYEIFVLGKKG